MEIKAKDFPLILFAFFETISPYFLAIYLFDKEEFLSLGLWNNILLSMAYSFPVIYMNLYIQRFKCIFKNGEIKEYPSDIINVCINSAHQQYSVLLICLFFFLDDSLFCFSHYRNVTWIWPFIGILFNGIKIIKQHGSTIKIFNISPPDSSGKTDK